MKKFSKFLLIALVVFSGCNETEESVVSKRDCGTMEVHDRLLVEDPIYAKRVNEIEEFTQNAIRSGNFRLVNGVIEIPIVYNVLYKTNTENVSQARLDAQTAVLNADFNATNADISSVPTLFQSSVGNVGIRFVQQAVYRKKVNKNSWSTNDDMKKTLRGGLNPTNPSQYLNIWVCNLGNGILGYAQFPGGPSATDGVVLLHSTLPGGTAAPYNLGRTATHEVGHYLNLRHIWGDATCGSDFVDDTPLHNAANYSCPTFPHASTCTGKPTEMTMNYMDYTDDACMYMFTNGQKSRILSVFATGGPRAAMAK